MENQRDIVQEVLERFYHHQILQHMVLVGSWCIPLYRDYYFAHPNISPLRTRDIDFLLPRKFKNIHKVDVPALVEDLGFLIEFNYPDGLMRLVHPDLIIEFLVPQIGKGTDGPFPIADLSMNAQPLRAVAPLLDHTVSIDIGRISVKLPHPIIYGFQKLISSKDRHQKDKRNRDTSVALEILHICSREEPIDKLIKSFRAFTEKQQKVILRLLQQFGADEILRNLEN
ncbi:MAG: nucleotidyltransferase domain-containing protein [Lentisphaeria bacterium]|nr:nucleotidyltransferase domain-containing protein [Candidatus Neomarinimicrobiota bacterium]MCF7841472.1 nucleotidyltransferase domain-containing protein [Lentisphaeria bacterium]